MEALSGVINAVMNPTVLKALTLGTTGMGVVGNILNQKARSDELGYLKNQQKILSDPTAMAKQVAAATQPLNTGLVQGVENQVQGTLAEQGLAQAPGIQAAVLSQALAPYYQQNQNTALQLVMERLGLPLQYASTYLSGLPQNSNLAPLMALLQRNNPSSTSSLPSWWPTSRPTIPTPTTTDPGLPPDIFNIPPVLTDTGGGGFDLGAGF